MNVPGEEQDEPLVSVAVINYCGREFLEALFDSLANQTFTRFETVLIDNDSNDGSVELTQKRFGWVRPMPQNRNLGFAKAGNLAARTSNAEFLVLLNADIRLAPDWLERLLEPALADPKTAAVASKMYLDGRPGVLNGVGGCMNRLAYTWDRGMGETDQGQYDEAAECLFASAGAALFRRQAFLDVGGFDERFFMYHEDVDLCWRLWLQGHRVVTAPKAIVHHHFGGSTAKTRGFGWRELLGERNAIRSILKNYEGRTLAPLLIELCLLPQSPRRKWGQVRNMVWNLLRLPETLKLRREVQRGRIRRDVDLEHLIVQSPDVPVRL